MACLYSCHKVQDSPELALGVDVCMTRDPLNQCQNTTERDWSHGDHRKILITLELSALDSSFSITKDL